VGAVLRMHVLLSRCRAVMWEGMRNIPCLFIIRRLKLLCASGWNTQEEKHPRHASAVILVQRGFDFGKATSSPGRSPSFTTHTKSHHLTTKKKSPCGERRQIGREGNKSKAPGLLVNAFAVIRLRPTNLAIQRPGRMPSRSRWSHNTAHLGTPYCAAYTGRVTTGDPVSTAVGYESV
jgi:hypothetical protein